MRSRIYGNSTVAEEGIGLQFVRVIDAMTKLLLVFLAIVLQRSSVQSYHGKMSQGRRRRSRTSSRAGEEEKNMISVPSEHQHLYYLHRRRKDCVVVF